MWCFHAYIYHALIHIFKSNLIKSRWHSYRTRRKKKYPKKRIPKHKKFQREGEKSWRALQFPDLKTYYRAIVTKRVWQWHEKTHINQLNWMHIPEMSPHRLKLWTPPLASSCQQILFYFQSAPHSLLLIYLSWALGISLSLLLGFYYSPWLSSMSRPERSCSATRAFCRYPHHHQ